VSWEVWPEPRNAAERAALVKAANQAVENEDESAWWRSGLEELDELSGGPAPKQAWGGASVVEEKSTT
jgi:hypothetical protein